MTESQETATAAPTVRVRITLDADINVESWRTVRDYDQTTRPTDAEIRDTVIDLARRMKPIAMMTLLDLMSDKIRVLP